MLERKYGRTERTGDKTRARLSGPAGVGDALRIGGAATDHHAKFSDLNVLCVLKEITPRELGEGEPMLALVARARPSAAAADERRGSAQLGRLLPHRISRHEGPPQGAVRRGRDRRVQVDRKFYRAQMEHELRAKLISSATAGRARSVRSGGADEAVRGFGVDVLHAGPACAGRGGRARQDGAARGGAATFATRCKWM